MYGPRSAAELIQRIQKKKRSKRWGIAIISVLLVCLGIGLGVLLDRTQLYHLPTEDADLASHALVAAVVAVLCAKLYTVMFFSGAMAVFFISCLIAECSHYTKDDLLVDIWRKLEKLDGA